VDGRGRLELIHKGAEAYLYRGVYAGVEAVYKYRVPKKYRHPELDARIRSSRTIREARIMLHARNSGVPVPAVLLVEP
jgi:Kae1-associated kinase Bud32